MEFKHYIITAAIGLVSKTDHNEYNHTDQYHSNKSNHTTNHDHSGNVNQTTFHNHGGNGKIIRQIKIITEMVSIRQLLTKEVT